MAAASNTRIADIERLVTAIDLPMARWDRGARLEFCNDHYLGWCGRAREELIGRTVTELFGDAAWAVAEPAFVRAFDGQTSRYERPLTHGPTPGRWLRIQVCPDADANARVASVFTIATDSPDEAAAREALSATQLRLDRFTENIPYPLTYVDRDCILRFVNIAYAEATRTRREDLIGQHIGLARGAVRWAEHEPFFRRALEGQTVQYTRLVNGLPNGPRWMRTSYVPDANPQGQVLGLYTVTVDVHELTVTQEKLKRRVERDSLTDVLSRRTMMDRIEAAVAESARDRVALFFVDLDGFKTVNDRLGHREGDALLVAVGAALQGALRAEDAVGRFGGDEFLVLAPVRNAEGASALARHLLAAIRSVTGSDDLVGGVSASVGYALAPDDAQQPMALLQLADDAMYAAKRCGKDSAMHCATRDFEPSR
ncbi:MAG: diguanylate cyclase [Burkholderiaceae bacterium]